MSRGLSHLERAALEWWQRKRPAGWTMSEHLTCPAIGARSTADDALARRCAAAMGEETEQ